MAGDICLFQILSTYFGISVQEIQVLVLFVV